MVDSEGAPVFRDIFSFCSTDPSGYEGNCERLVEEQTSEHLQKENWKNKISLLESEITNRKKAEENLRQMSAELAKTNERLLSIQEQQKALLDSIPDIAWFKDEQSRFIAVNLPFAQSCGFSPDDLVGKTDLDIWPKDLAELYRADDKQVIETGIIKRVEEPLIDYHGCRTWIETIKVPVLGQEGRVIGTVGIARDVTERRNLDEALRESEKRFRMLFEDAPNPILILDENFCYMDTNKSALDFFDMERMQVIGKNVWEILPQMFEERHWDSASPPETTEISYFVGEKEKTILLSMIPLTLSGKKVHYCIGNDITQRKVLEKKLMENSELEQRRLGQELHDDVGQLLAGIAFMGKALEQKLTKKAPEEAREMATLLSYINQAVARTQSLARGMFPVELEAAGLMSALRELSIFTDGLFKINCMFLCDSPVFINDNEIAIHLYRIAQEAIRNAIKHGPARHITVELSSSDGSIALRVKDDGKGFKEVPLTPGGLGLNIMRYRAASIGAVFDIRTGEGGGTIVTCVLPVKTEPPPGDDYL